jgi:hypothetical protein
MGPPPATSVGIFYILNTWSLLPLFHLSLLFPLLCHHLSRKILCNSMGLYIVGEFDLWKLVCPNFDIQGMITQPYEARRRDNESCETNVRDNSRPAHSRQIPDPDCFNYYQRTKGCQIAVDVNQAGSLVQATHRTV